MRELLKFVLDRIGECPSGWEDPDGLVPELKWVVERILDEGIFDGRMTDIDMRQLPPALR